MVYLHENREEFMNAINLLSEYFRVLPIIESVRIGSYIGG